MGETSLGITYPTTNDISDDPGQSKSRSEKIDELLLRAGAQAKKCIIPGENSRENTLFGTMETPDRVTGVILPTDGLIFVAYQALWQESVAKAARSTIFVGTNQLKVRRGESQGGNSNPAQISAATPSGMSGGGVWLPLHSTQVGLMSTGATTASEAEVTTGEVVGSFTNPAEAKFAPAFEFAGVYPRSMATAEAFFGGVCVIFAAAGTYEVSIQFKSSSGNVKVKERKLWVWTKNFI